VLLIEVYLDRPKRVLVTVHTGWNEIIEGSLVVKSIVGNIRFDLGDAICDVSRHDGSRLGAINCRTGKERDEY